MIAPRQEYSASLSRPHPLLLAFYAWKRQWKRSAALFTVMMSLIIAGVFLWPKTYRSEAKLFVRMGRESVTLDPTATTGQIVSVYESRENEINSILEVIQSRVILERVVDVLGPEYILHGRSAGKVSEKQETQDKQEKSVRRSSVYQPEPHSPIREKAIRKLERTIHVSHAKKSSVINISCKAAAPKMAQQIVSTILDAFHELHLRVNRTAGSREFFAEQVELLRKKLDRANSQLRDAKNELGLATVSGRQKSLETQIRASRLAVSTNHTELAAATATVASLKISLAALPKRLETQRVVGFPNGAADRIRQRLNDLKIRERELLTKYTVRYPQVVSVQKQIQEAEQILKKEGPRAAQSTTASHPAAVQLKLKLLTEESRAASFAARSTLLRKTQQRLIQELQSLNQQEGRLAELVESVDLLRGSHRAYSEKLEQARIDGALGEQRISNVNVVQPPTFVTKPVSPKKRIIALLGVFVAIIASMGFALLTEFRQKSRKRKDSDANITGRTATAESVVQQAGITELHDEDCETFNSHRN